MTRTDVVAATGVTLAMVLVAVVIWIDRRDQAATQPRARPAWAATPAAQHPPVPTTGAAPIPAVTAPTGPVDVPVDPAAVVVLGRRTVHRDCLRARRDAGRPCGECKPVLVGPADSAVWGGSP